MPHCGLVEPVAYTTTQHEVGKPIEIPGPEWSLSESSVVVRDGMPLSVVILWVQCKPIEHNADYDDEWHDDAAVRKDRDEPHH